MASQHRSPHGIAGAIAACSALGIAETLSSLDATSPTIVEAAGLTFIDQFAATLKDVAVAIFGTHHKTALIIGTWVVIIGLATAASSSPKRSRRNFTLLVAVIGVVGLAAFLTRPLSNAPLGVIAITAGLVTGLVLHRHLLRITTPATSIPPIENTLNGIDGITPFITPNSDFYRIDTALVIPKVDPSTWSLTIDGMVDRPETLTYQDLIEASTEVETVTIACVSNEVGGNLVGNATWQGVRLADVLKRAGIQQGASQIVGHSVDGFTAGMPTATALDGRVALIATAMNGTPLPQRHGFPARLIVSGLYGYVSATKWLSRIELTTWEATEGYWIPRGWSKEAPVKLTSRIDVPQRSSISAGVTPIAGIALSPSIGISRVEVSINDGPWQSAELGDHSNDNTWVQWHLPWHATNGDHVIRVRAIDNDGNVQDETPRSVAPDGATGFHRRRVTVR